MDLLTMTSPQISQCLRMRSGRKWDRLLIRRNNDLTIIMINSREETSEWKRGKLPSTPIFSWMG